MDEIIQKDCVSPRGLHSANSNKNGYDLGSIQSYYYVTRTSHQQTMTAV